MHRRHPEIRDGEVFIGNSRMIGLKLVIHDIFDELAWETKRKGNVAYTRSGVVIDGAYPIFIQLSEYEKKYGKANME